MMYTIVLCYTQLYINIINLELVIISTLFILRSFSNYIFSRNINSYYIINIKI